MPIRRLLLALTLLPAASFATVHYTLSPEPQNKSVRVTIRLDDPKEAETFRIPAWCPGFYFLEQYQTKISDFKAVGDGGPLAVDHSRDKRAWTVTDPDKKAYTVSYRVLGDDPGLGFFATSVLDHTAFVNGPSAFMFAEGRLTEPTTLDLNLPDGWNWATAMDPSGPNSFKAEGYDELIDMPIQMGHFEVRKFEVEKVPFQVVFVSRDQTYRPDLDAETARLKAIAAPAFKLFGGSAFKRYIFFIHLAVGNFDGGLEHRACNVQAVSNTKPLDIDDLAAHEYFHAWNVKQIRPKVLGPFDYTKEQRTGNLWFAEGVTDYYAKITTYRSGLHDANWLLQQLGSQVSQMQSSANRRRYTVADASRMAWENGGFGIGDLSYYVKGLLAGWIFDAAIRDATDGKKSLDDVMRLLYAKYRLPNPGYEENGILLAINEVAGTDLTDLYERMIHSTAELPYGELTKLGLLVDPESFRVSFDPKASARAVGLRDQWLGRPGGIGEENEQTANETDQGRVKHQGLENAHRSAGITGEK